MTRRGLYGAVLLDAVLGTIVAVGSIAHQFSAVPFPGMSRLQDMATFMGFTFTDPGGILLWVVPAFLSTLVLAPLLIKVLHGSAPPPLNHYAFGAAAGCVFGFAATVGTCFFLGGISAFLPGPGTIVTRIVVLIGGPLFMATAGGIAFSVLFAKEILVTGAAFGIFNAWLVRRSRYGGEGPDPARARSDPSGRY